MADVIIDPEQIKAALYETAILPGAFPIVKIFCFYVDLSTIEYQNRGQLPPSFTTRHYFIADVDDAYLGLCAVLQVSPATDNVQLEFFSQTKADYQSSGSKNKWFSIAFTELSAGLWDTHRGQLKTLGIRINLPHHIDLPSKESRWLIGFLDAFAKMAIDYKDINDQPNFWDVQGGINGDKG